MILDDGLIILTVQCSIYDAPAENELVVALGAATGGRPSHRLGDS